jgi:hypothetical protein
MGDILGIIVLWQSNSPVSRSKSPKNLILWWISMVNDATGEAVSVEYVAGQNVGSQAQLKAASDLALENRVDHRVRHVLLVNPNLNVANETPEQLAQLRQTYKKRLKLVESSRHFRIQRRKQRISTRLLALELALAFGLIIALVQSYAPLTFNQTQ